jgi:ribonuclease Z
MASRRRNRPSQSNRVTCLGTGDGFPCADRHHSSYLYEVAGSTVLIDCGESVTRSLKARGFDWNRLDAIMLSHTHADHVGGVFMLLQGLWLERRSRPLTVYLPAHAIAPLRRMLRHGYLFPELLGFEVEFSPLRAGRAMAVGRLKVTPFPTSHLTGLRRAFHRRYRVGFEAFSFLLAGAGRRIVHSGDLGAPRDLRPLLDEPVDLLICELAHFEPTELFDTLRGCSIRRAAFIHLAREVRQRLASVRQLARRSLSRTRCHFPDDGDELPL